MIIGEIMSGVDAKRFTESRLIIIRLKKLKFLTKFDKMEQGADCLYGDTC